MKKGKLTCQICGSAKTEVYLELGKYNYHQCKKCTIVFVDPIHEQSFYLETETYLSDPSAGYVDRIDPLGQRWMAEQLERLYEKKFGTLQRGKLLEVGAGIGFLELVALARGWEVNGLEISKSAVEFARKYMRVPVSHSTIEEYKTKDQYDAVVMVEVLEHFLDPKKAVDALKKFSTKHTLLFGTTPNTDSEHWKKSKQNIFVPEDHIFLFNEKSLRVFADKVGIHDLSVEFFGSGEKNDSNLMYAGVLIGENA